MVYILLCSLPESLNDVINHLKLNVTQETHEYNVRRDEVFSDLMREAKKRSFSPYKRVMTYFVYRGTRERHGGSYKRVMVPFCKACPTQPL